MSGFVTLVMLALLPIFVFVLAYLSIVNRAARLLTFFIYPVGIYLLLDVIPAGGADNPTNILFVFVLLSGFVLSLVTQLVVWVKGWKRVHG